MIFPVMKHKQHRSELLCREVTFPLKGIHTYLFKVTKAQISAQSYCIVEQIEKEVAMAVLSLPTKEKQKDYLLLILLL